MALKAWRRQDTVRGICPHCEKSVVELKNMFHSDRRSNYGGTCGKCKRKFALEVEPGVDFGYDGALSTGEE